MESPPEIGFFVFVITMCFMVVFLLLMVVLARWILGTSHIIRLLKKQNELIEKQSRDMEVVANALHYGRAR
ncbi:MAG: hypothetical protein GXY41_07410 [Phycisphaerae bacterium]|nr:hypothetical protein [Phycisphaerae bacterium]